MKGRRLVLRELGLLILAPQNDFLSEGGIYWPSVQDVAEAVHLIDNLKAILDKCRHIGVPIFYLPHRNWREGDLDGWTSPSPAQLDASRSGALAHGSWGADWHPELAPRLGDVIIKEHWGQSGFANTDLDFVLRQRLVRRLIVVGMGANTFVETTAKFGAELGYHVCLVTDATAAFGPEAMHAAHCINGPTYAHVMLTTEQLLTDLADA